MHFDVHFAWEILPSLLRGAIVTVEATFGGMALALVGGLLLAVGRMSKLPLIPFLSLCYIQFMRNTPLLVQLYFVFYVLPFVGLTFNALATGIVGLGLNYSAYIAEVYRAGIEGVAAGQWEASTALNMTRGQMLRRIILPQAVVAMIPPWGNLFIELLKATALVSLITITDLSFKAQEMNQTTLKTVDIFSLVLLIYLALSLAITIGMRLMEAGASRGLARGRMH